MSQLQCLYHYIFGDFIGPTFNHKDRVARACNSQVQVGGFDFSKSWVDDKLTVHASHTNCRHRAAPGDI